MGKHTESKSNCEINKPTYEELESIIKQISEEANSKLKEMYKQLQDLNMANAFKRLDFLFKVVENSDKFNEDFLSKCIEEIQEAMIIEQPDTDK